MRQGKGHVEKIGEALLKLSAVSHSYHEYLTSQPANAEEKYGKEEVHI